MSALHRAVVAAGVVTVLVLLGVLSIGTNQTATAAQTTVVRTTSDTQHFHGTGHYVALGDSFAGGPFIPEQRTDPIGCMRSTHNYPALVAKALDVGDFTDRTCIAALTDNMVAPQSVPLGSNPPQFDALRPDTDLVTVTIGGNDIGFSDIIFTCGELSVTDPLGAPCKRQATAGGTDRYAERISATAPKVADVLQGIRERSPDATVVLVGYLRILPPAVGCWPTVPVARGDVPYLDGIQQQFITMLATQAEANGARFADAYTASLGHDACQMPGVKWVESMVLTRPGFWVHPNAAGMRAVAELTLTTLTSG